MSSAFTQPPNDGFDHHRQPNESNDAYFARQAEYRKSIQHNLDQIGAETRDIASHIGDFIQRSGHLFDPEQVNAMKKIQIQASRGMMLGDDAYAHMSQITRGIYDYEAPSTGNAPDFIPDHISDQFRG